MIACTCTDIIVMTGISPRFHRYLYLSNLTQIGRDMGLSKLENGVHACMLACTCTDIIVITDMIP